jgi:tol-pal system protein YbgF
MTAMKKLVLVSLWLSIYLFSLSAHAALFDDKEARKKILEVEAATQATDSAQQATLNELKKSQAAIEKRLVAIEAVVQGQGLADMQNQIEQLRREVATLKGDLEVASHSLDTTQQRQKDLYADTDNRLRKIEGGVLPIPVGAPPAPASIDPANAASTMPPVTEEKDSKAFSDADNLSKSAKHKEAFAAFDSFLKLYPTSKLAADALYGMGYSQFALKSYKSSIATQQKVLDLHPDSAKVPDAMFNMANSQIQLGQVANAKRSLRELIAKFPDAAVTPAAQRRLKALEAIK